MIEDFIKGPILPKTCIDELIYKQLDAKIANDLLTSSPIKVYATIEGTKKILVDKLPDKYIINKDATILFWEDGDKTVVKKASDEEFNKRLGFLTAYFQKHSGMTKTQANKYLDNLVVTAEQTKMKQKEVEVKMEEIPIKKAKRKRKEI